MEKRIKLTETTIEINSLRNVVGSAPIYSKRDGRFSGMLIKQNGDWIHRVGGDGGACGFKATREEAIAASERLGHIFFLDVE